LLCGLPAPRYCRASHLLPVRSAARPDRDYVHGPSGVWRRACRHPPVLHTLYVVIHTTADRPLGRLQCPHPCGRRGGLEARYHPADAQCLLVYRFPIGAAWRCWRESPCVASVYLLCFSLCFVTIGFFLPCYDSCSSRANAMACSRERA